MKKRSILSLILCIMFLVGSFVVCVGACAHTDAGCGTVRQVVSSTPLGMNAYYCSRSLVHARYLCEISGCIVSETDEIIGVRHTFNENSICARCGYEGMTALNNN